MAELPKPEPELQLAIELARLADQTRCQNVVLLDVRQKSPVTKFFLIATGTSDRQRRTAADELVRYGKNHDFPAWRTNGYETAKWIVVDFIDVVAHIFEEASRNFYDLEMLWGDCPRVAWALPQPLTAATPVEQPAQAAAAIPDVKAEVPAEVQESVLVGPAISEIPAATEIEEFVDHDMLTTVITENGEVVETQEVEITAVPASEITIPIAKKRPMSRPGKRRAKPAAKRMKVVKRRGHIAVTAPERTGKPPSGKKSTTVKAPVVKSGKIKKVLKPRAVGTALKKPAVRKKSVGHTQSKRITARVKDSKKRVAATKIVKKSKVKVKKG